MNTTMENPQVKQDDVLTYNLNTNYITLNGDCTIEQNINILTNLIQNQDGFPLKINHIITDPPYAISKINRLHTMGRKGVYFGDWDLDKDLIIRWIEPYSKLLDKNGSMIIFCGYRDISRIIEELENNDMEMKDLIQWRKDNPMPRNITRRYVQDTEFAIWAVKKNSKWIFNKPDDVPYLRSIFNAPVVAGKERTEHPTQKSLSVMKKIIEIHTNPNDLILDLFMGSGTTGVAALELGRKFVGFEKDEKYFSIANHRLASV